MAQYIPPLSGYDFCFGDQYKEYDDADYIMNYLHVFIRVPQEITANQLALYFRMHENQGGTNPLISNIIIAEMGENYVDPWPEINPITVATNINLTDYLQPPEGWKWIPISDFTFQANEMYVVDIHITSAEAIGNKLNDMIYVALAEKIAPPYAPGLPPPDFPVDHLTQTINYYSRVLGGSIEWGNYSRWPIAIAVRGEAVGEGFATITNINAPSNAYEGDAVQITSSIRNDGSVSDELWSTLTDTDNETIIGTRQSATHNSSETLDYSWTLTMPSKNLNIRLDAGHVE